MSIRKTLARNTTFNAAGRVWEAVANIVLVAYVVPRLEWQAWGLWALIGAFTGYISLLDFGIGSGFTKYIAEHSARDEREHTAAIINSGFFFYAILGALLVAVGWLLVDPIINLIGRLSPGSAESMGNPVLLDDAKFLLRAGIVFFAVSNCVAPFSAVQTGLQRMGITNVISIATSALKVIATVMFINAGWGVRGLMYANFAAFALYAVASVAVAFYLIPSLRLSPSHVNTATIGRLFSYGWKTQISKLSNLITFQTDKIIVGLFYKSLGMVGVYRVGEELASKMRQAPVLLLTAIIPAASDLDARGDQERLRRLYILSSKYVGAVTVPLVAYCIGSSGALIRAWIGDMEHLDTAAWVCRIIAFGYLANIIPGAGVSIALGTGRPDVQMKAGIIATVSNLVLTIALVYTIGFYGVPIATAASMVLSCVWFLRAMYPIVGVGFGQVAQISLLWPALASVPGFILCVVGDWYTADAVGRMPNAITVCATAACFGLSYLALIRRMPFLDSFDADFLSNVVGLKRIPGFTRWLRRTPA